MSLNRKELKKSFDDLDNPSKRKLNPNLKEESKIGYSGANPSAIPWMDIYTPNGLIDMSRTRIPVLANGRILPPFSGIHQFNDKVVREYALYKRGGEPSAAKAEEMLHNPPHGRELTDKQRKYFAYLAYGKKQTGGQMSSQDSLEHLARKTLRYEKERGSAYGTGLSNYGNPALGANPTEDQALDWYMQNITPQLTPFSSAMQKGEAGDFMYNTGKDARAYAIQEHLRKTDPQNKTGWQDASGKYKDRANPVAWDPYWKEIQKLPENEQRVLINKGRDWYYQNINNPSPGVPSPAYDNTWYGRIWNTNDMGPYRPNDPKFIPKHQDGSETGEELSQEELYAQFRAEQDRINAQLKSQGQIYKKDPSQVASEFETVTPSKLPFVDPACTGPWCATAATAQMAETYEDAPPPTTGGDTYMSEIWSGKHPDFTTTSKLYRDVQPGSLMQFMNPRKDKEGNIVQGKFESGHNVYIVGTKDLGEGKKLISTSQSPGGDYTIRKNYIIDKDNKVFHESGSPAPSAKIIMAIRKRSFPNTKKRDELGRRLRESFPDMLGLKRYDKDFKPDEFYLNPNNPNGMVAKDNSSEWVATEDAKLDEILSNVSDPSYRKKIMKEYNISNDEYNAVIKTMVGMYGQETKFDTDYWGGNKLPEPKLGAYLLPESVASTHSIGPFQINQEWLGRKTRRTLPNDNSERVAALLDPVTASDTATRFLAENVSRLRKEAGKGDKKNMTKENYLDYLPYMASQQGWLTRSDEQSMKDKGSILGEGTNAYREGVDYYSQMAKMFPSTINTPIEIRQFGGQGIPPLEFPGTGTASRESTNMMMQPRTARRRMPGELSPMELQAAAFQIRSNNNGVTHTPEEIDILNRAGFSNQAKPTVGEMAGDVGNFAHNALSIGLSTGAPGNAFTGIPGIAKNIVSTSSNAPAASEFVNTIQAEKALNLLHKFHKGYDANHIIHSGMEAITPHEVVEGPIKAGKMSMYNQMKQGGQWLDKYQDGKEKKIDPSLFQPNARAIKEDFMRRVGSTSGTVYENYPALWDAEGMMNYAINTNPELESSLRFNQDLVEGAGAVAPVAGVGAVAKNSKKIKAAVEASKESGILSEAYKLNPYAFKPNPNAYYRRIGDEAGLQDLFRSGKLRPVQNPTPKMIGNINLQKTFSEPYFSKGVPFDARYGPKNQFYKGPYMAEVTDHPFLGRVNNRASKSDMIGVPKTAVELQNPNMKIYKEHWLEGYKEVPKGGYRDNFQDEFTRKMLEYKKDYKMSEKNPWMNPPNEYIGPGDFRHGGQWLEQYQGGKQVNPALFHPMVQTMVDQVNKTIAPQGSPAFPADYVQDLVRDPGTVAPAKERDLLSYLSQANRVLTNPAATIMSLGHGDDALRWSMEHEDNAIDATLGIINPFQWIGNVPDAIRRGDYVDPVLNIAGALVGQRFIGKGGLPELPNPMTAAKPYLKEAKGLIESSTKKAKEKLQPIIDDLNPFFGKSIDDITPENIKRYLGKELDPKGPGRLGGSHYGVYEMKKNPNYVIKFESPNRQQIDNYKDIFMPDYYKNITSPNISKTYKQYDIPGAHMFDPPKRALIMDKISGENIIRTTPSTLRNIPEETLKIGYHDMDNILKNKLEFDMAGHNINYDPKTQRLGFFDLDPKIANPQSAESYFWNKQALTGLDPKSPTYKADLKKTMEDLMTRKMEDAMALYLEKYKHGARMTDEQLNNYMLQNKERIRYNVRDALKNEKRGGQSPWLDKYM